jgi:hypothetical protein
MELLDFLYVPQNSEVIVISLVVANVIQCRLMIVVIISEYGLQLRHIAD